MPQKIDPNADTHLRHRQNWQRLIKGAATFTLITDGTTISNAGGSLHVVSGGIGTTQLANDSVTFAKMQNIATDTLIGRDTAGTGDPESIGVTGGIVFTGAGAIQIAAFTGDATKTLGGTALTLATVNANVGTWNNVTINAKGLATAGSNVAYLTANQTITLTGDVTGSGATGIATTIANDAVTNAKLANMATQTFKGRTTAGSGDPEDLSTAQAKTLLDLTGTNSGDQTITLTGDVTGGGMGSFAATIANDAVTYAKIQNVTDNRLLGRSAGSTGDVMEITVSTGLLLSGGVLTCTVTGFTTPLTTKGDIHVWTTTDARLAVGTNEQILVADSAATAGVAWRSPLVATAVQIANIAVFNTTTKTALSVGLGKTLTSAQITDLLTSTGKTAIENIHWAGSVSCANAGDTLTITLDAVGGVAGATVTAIHTHVLTMAGTETNVPIMIEGFASWSGGGATGNMRGCLRITYGSNPATVYLYVSSANTVIDTTGTVNRVQISAQWSATRTTDLITQRVGWVEFVSRGLLQT